MRVSRSMFSVAFIFLALAGLSFEVFAQAIPQKNVNVIGPTPINWLYTGNPRMQQNEPDCAVSPGNPEWLFCGVNDYRGVNDPAIGDSFQGIAMSRDGGKTWISGLHPGHLGDSPNISKKFAADPNAEALPNFLLYNFIAGWRDDSFPGGVYVSRWYEHNREVGPPWEYLDTIEVATGTSGKFLDKPAFLTALYDPSLGRAPIIVNIPAFDDPRNLANSHGPYTLEVPAARTHLCYAVFVGNDNNSGTKIECTRSDDGGVTWAAQKISESVEINQGVSLATRNGGQEVLAVWRRFNDNNETSSIMYALSTDFGDTFSKAEVLTEFCAFDQGTGPARFRTNALPVATSNGQDFAVYFTARNDATKTCFEPQKGNRKDAPLVFSMSDADPAFDFDSFEENRDGNGKRIRDGKIRSALNYARIFMVRESAGGNFNWSTPEMVDPQTVDGSSNPNAARKPFHQFMPAVGAAGGVETVAWYDSRFDKLINRPNPLPGGFVEDLVLNVVPGTTPLKASLLPAGFYEIEPPPVPIAELPDPANNIPLRRNIDVMAAQFKNGSFANYVVDGDFYPVSAGAAGGANSPSVRVTRFATRPKPGAPGEKEQLEFNHPNGRLFQKGKAPFIGDYNTVFAQPARQRDDLTWVSNQAPPQPNELYSSSEPVFHVGWTSNRNVRGRVFYTGCDVWDETLQMWVASPGCDSTYNDPNPPVPVNPAMMIPLQGEDGSTDGPPLACADATGQGRPLTRNQNVFVAAMKPGVSAEIVSAIKFPDGVGNTFVLSLSNGTKESRRLRLVLPAASSVSFDKPLDRSPGGDPLLDILVNVPRGSGNVRTIFDVANKDQDSNYTPVVIVEIFDVTGLSEGQAGQLIARVPLLRETLAPLENVQNNDPTDLRNITDPGASEFYDIILTREIGKRFLDLENLDLENLDLENTVTMLDLENLDLENLDLENLDLENLDLENLDLENLDLENIVLFLNIANLDLENLDLENALYENLDLENSDLANLDLENLDLENLDLENRGLLFLDLENLDLENEALLQLDLENLDLENLDLENLDLENLDLENLDLENLDLENLDLENDTIYASAIENLDLENLDLENTAPGDTYTEVTWTAGSATNTTTGVDIKPLFSKRLTDAILATTEEGGDDSDSVPDTRILLTVRKPYLTSTVQNNAFNGGSSFCTPQVVVENQLVYAALLTPQQLNDIIEDPDPTDPTTPSFVLDPDATNIITLRLINPPTGFSDIQTASRNVGLALYTQPGDTAACDEGGNDVSEVCEIDFVVDQDPPVITLLGDNPQTVEAGSAYAEAGATALDVIDGDVSTSIIIDASAVDTGNPGSYTVTYTVTDEAGNIGTATRTVDVEDTTAPVVTLLGSATVTVEAATAYSDAGATASDTLDGDLTAAIVTVNPVDVNMPATYTVTYDVSDAAGNAAAQVARTVIVQDTTAPVISLTGAATVTHEAATPYVDAGATASDTLDGDLTAAIITVNPVDVNVPGTYVVTYDVSDASLNAAAQVTRTVIVEDTTKPVITLLGTSPLVIEGGFGYADAGATAFDTLDGDLTSNIEIVDAVDSGSVGSYTVTYNVADAAGNAADEVTRFVTIVDTTQPLITLVGPASVSIEAGDAYVDQGATASDAVDGDLTAQIFVNNPVNTAVIGTYIVTYNVTDGAGLAATPVARTVTVVDTTDPVITNPNPPAFVPTGPYVLPPGATELPITWPISARDLENGLTISCTVGGVELTPASSSYDETTGELTTTFSNNFEVGETTGFCTVTDAGGNSVTTPEFAVFVEDIPVATPTQAVLNVATDSGTTLTANLTNVELAANITATDAVDDAAGVPLNIQCTPTGDFAIGDTEVTCIVSDSAGNSTDATDPKTNAIFTVNVQYPYDVVFEKIKGNINAGSSLPVDFSYVDSATGTTVDSSGFMPSAVWIGPYTDSACSNFATGETRIEASEDAGSSNFRYSASQATWQYSWDTPMNGGFYYRFTVSPPGVDASSICVRLR